ncbi:cupin domain-containing protein [Petroclostridium sp. X23]|uniref:cupin domain-containing protein n=1 Tax=Petroclostridium sp. X23 TaxID=3045146 RepID=UPI0024ACC029|nr:cupin domain-containing protein [Petroclostridium sp. X23]WHH61169.1 cupin domain-containing protein [Petroclostridium sp. X23]
MLEKKYEYSITKEKLVERIVDDENIHLNHMVLTKGTSLPEHYSNSNVYMIVIRGTMTLQLNEQGPQQYAKGNIVNISYNTKMNVYNQGDEVLEFFVVKSPNPKNYKE